jgi:predicted RNase H-like HicB family nuclease
MSTKTKTLQEYKLSPYTLRTELVREPDGSEYWTAEYLELRGCKTDGSEEAEAVANVQELFDEYITARLESGTEIPEPTEPPIATREAWLIVPQGKWSLPDSSKIDFDTKDTGGDMKTISSLENELAAA